MSVATRADSLLVPGFLISGKYRLMKRLGSGGMGTVWVARHERLNMDVAIKILRGSSRQSIDTQRLLREARIAANIAHPAIVRVFDFGEVDARLSFIVMEYLRGERLRDYMQRVRSTSPEEAIRLLLPIAQALCVLAEQGILHRDVKPENIILVDDHDRVQPKILDFGVALAPDGERLTAAGTVVGTMSYVAPEQIECAPLDARVDVWAFAVVLYELIAGRRPFNGKSTGALLHAIKTGRPPHLSTTGVCDVEFEYLLERGLRRDREDRYPSMRHFGMALASWAVGKGVGEDVTHQSISGYWLSRSGPAPSVKRDPKPEVIVETSGVHTCPTLLDGARKDDIELEPLAMPASPVSAPVKIEVADAPSAVEAPAPSAAEAPTVSAIMPRTPSVAEAPAPSVPENRRTSSARSILFLVLAALFGAAVTSAITAADPTAILRCRDP